MQENTADSHRRRFSGQIKFGQDASRLIVLNVPGADCKVLINPEVTRRIGTRVVNEGCLSIPVMSVKSNAANWSG